MNSKHIFVDTIGSANLNKSTPLSSKYMHSRLFERFNGLLKYAIDTRGQNATIVRNSIKDKCFLVWQDTTDSGVQYTASLNEAMRRIMNECLDELEYFMNTQITQGKGDDLFKKVCSKFITEVASPVGKIWKNAFWLDLWGDEFQRDNDLKNKYIDELAAAFMSHCISKQKFIVVD